MCIRDRFTSGALARFAAKKNLRLLEIAPASEETGRAARVLKQVSGGFLMQDADRRRIAEADLTVVTRRAPTAEERRALMFAWSVCKHVKSNAIVYARCEDGHGQTVGIGAGQMSLSLIHISLHGGGADGSRSTACHLLGWPMRWLASFFCAQRCC